MSAVDPSRRQWLRKVFLMKADGPPAEAVSLEAVSEGADVPKRAIIQGRHCLAYQRSFCSVCSERCPVDGAIKVESGIPQVIADACTGCGICHEVCPAPTNAILILPAMGGKGRNV